MIILRVLHHACAFGKPLRPVHAGVCLRWVFGTSRSLGPGLPLVFQALFKAHPSLLAKRNGHFVEAQSPLLFP